MKNTLTAQKNRLTREIKAQAEYVGYLTRQWEQQGKPLFFWFLGHKLSKFDIRKQEHDLSNLKKERENLNKI